ncbi:uncharacterized protein [Antedon mediterranea]|uniref:uncharacterized protein n=1 Tax=Antedon mediterranea TaxID=105859 RepID=UPI003AF65A5E
MFLRKVILFFISTQVYAQNAKLLNVDLFCPRATIDSSSAEEVIIIGYTQNVSKPVNLTVSRLQNQAVQTVISENGVAETGSTNFPAGTQTTVGADGDFLSVRIPGTVDTKDKIGGFYFRVDNRVGSGYTGVVLQSSSASTVPVERTITSGLGDRVTIQMTTDLPNNDLRWRHNYGDVVTKWNGLSNVTIDIVRLKDDGIYECFHENSPDENAGFTRLIVRECSSSRWNPPVCDKMCPVCYNGGVCDAVSGTCICLPGFKGHDCAIVCASDTFSRDCLSACSALSNEGCRGSLICPSDPVGCSCANGFGGKSCTETCEPGLYGAGCNRVCNCDPEFCDRRSGCIISNCLPGYTGPQCQELTLASECPEGYYGVLCNYQCHCKYSTRCDRDGKCSGGCDTHWNHGSGSVDCSIALAVLSHPPRVVSRNQSSITIDFTWSPEEDYGTGDVSAHLLHYNLTTDDMTTEFLSKNQYTIQQLPADSLVSFYVEHIQVFNNSNLHGPLSPVGTALTTCTEPKDKPSITVLRSGDTAKITLQGVQSIIQRIGCDRIIEYEVRYMRSYDMDESMITVDYDYDKHVSITGLSECLAYQIDARVVNNEKFKGPWSNTVETEGTLPAPKNLRDSKVKDRSFTIQWETLTCSEGDMSYNYALTNDDVTLAESSTLDTVHVFEEGITPCTRYDVTVFASANDVTGVSSTISVITHPAAPQVDHSKVTTSSIYVKWLQTTCTRITGYHVVLNGTGFDKNKNTSDVYVVFDEEDGVSANSMFTIKIAAITDNGYGPYSSELTVSTPVSTYDFTTLIPSDSSDLSTTSNGTVSPTTDVIVGGDIIAIVVGSALVIIIIMSCIRVIRSRIRDKGDTPEMVDLNINKRYSKDGDYSSNSTTNDTFTETHSST